MIILDGDDDARPVPIGGCSPVPEDSCTEAEAEVWLGAEAIDSVGVGAVALLYCLLCCNFIYGALRSSRLPSAVEKHTKDKRNHIVVRTMAKLGFEETSVSVERHEGLYFNA